MNSKMNAIIKIAITMPFFRLVILGGLCRRQMVVQFLDEPRFVFDEYGCYFRNRRCLWNYRFKT